MLSNKELMNKKVQIPQNMYLLYPEKIKTKKNKLQHIIHDWAKQFFNQEERFEQNYLLSTCVYPTALIPSLLESATLNQIYI